jgi:hypothetical protein
MNKKKLWYPAAMVIALSVAFSAAQAKSLEQVGAAEGQAEPLKTYGVDVAAKTGLKALLPSGWNLFIYKNTSLPQNISWTVTDTWITALDKFAGSNNLAVRLDWSKKAVYISSPEVAMEARAKLAEIDNAARTPLPAYAPAAKVAAAAQPPVATPPVIAAALSAAPQYRPVTPTTAPITPAPAAAPVTASSEVRVPADVLARALAATAPRAEPAKPLAPATVPAMPAVSALPALPPLPPPGASSPALSPAPQAVASAQQPATSSDAFVRGNMEDIVRKTAAKLGYLVSWETIALPLDGPVTFLGVDAAEDMRLLQKSLGNRQSPISVEVYRGSELIRITPNAPGKEPVAVYSSSFSGLIGYGQKNSSAALAAASSSTGAAQGRPLASTAAVPPPARTSVVAPPSIPGAAVAQTAPVVKAAPAIAPAPAIMTLKIAKGESLSKTIAQFLKVQGWEMKWQVPNDMEAGFQFTAEGTTIAQVLGKLLPKLGLDTDVYGPSKMVVIRVIDNSAD